MKYVIDPIDITADWCPVKCATLCKHVVYPMYGVIVVPL
jgi:hypothetical protein